MSSDKKMITEVKPIRQTIINFESDEEYEEFIKSIFDSKKEKSEETLRLRELMRRHRKRKEGLNSEN